MIVAVANHSGGAGKTIVANNLALLRARVAIVPLSVPVTPQQVDLAALYREVFHH